MRRVLLVLAVGLFSAFARALGPAPRDAVQFERNVVYGKGGTEDLVLDLARPVQVEVPVPCIVVIHGGAWISGNKEPLDDIIREIAQHGWVGASIDYRLAPKYPFPAQIEDAKCAVRFLRANAQKYGIDRTRVGAMGFSAGGHLSMMLGEMQKADGFEGNGGWADQPSRVQAVVSFFGPTDLLARDYCDFSKDFIRKFIGGTPAEKADLYRKASPVSYVRQGDPPMLLFQGSKDPLVPCTQAREMMDAMTQAGVPGRLEMIAGAGHGWEKPEMTRTLDEAYAFFAEQFKE